MSWVKGVIAGNFDVLHPGYIKMFKEMSEHCEVLVVLLHTDPSIERPNKHKPILSVEDRKEMLLRLSCVDEVRIFNQLNPNEILELLQPDIHVKSVEGYKELEGPTIDKFGGILVLFPDEEGYSTINLLK